MLGIQKRTLEKTVQRTNSELKELLTKQLARTRIHAWITKVGYAEVLLSEEHLCSPLWLAAHTTSASSAVFFVI